MKVMVHVVKNAALHWFEAVADVRQRSCGDHGQCIIQVSALGLVGDRYLFNNLGHGTRLCTEVHIPDITIGIVIETASCRLENYGSLCNLASGGPYSHYGDARDCIKSGLRMD